MSAAREKDSLRRKGFGRSAVSALAALGLGLLLADLVVHRHVHFPFESLTGFYALAGAAAACLFIALARFLLGPLVRRDEGYYRRAEDHDAYGEDGHD